MRSVLQLVMVMILTCPAAALARGTIVYAGGSFGRRANTGSDYIVEAVSIAKANRVARDRPVVLTPAPVFDSAAAERTASAFQIDARPPHWRPSLAGLRRGIAPDPGRHDVRDEEQVCRRGRRQLQGAQRAG